MNRTNSIFQITILLLLLDEETLITDAVHNETADISMILFYNYLFYIYLFF